ncbi:hypothetical protein EVAR_38270_1 [Eumeta japonica]|uniref:Uncharacterized protein n=1 Tax=Eumeta variegata TaxID=151549 RepID=A0A4C1W8C3_EUMVA|nr:hypothetical protein EVAR_38270_1 [Eumeta japonica]
MFRTRSGRLAALCIIPHKTRSVAAGSKKGLVGQTPSAVNFVFSLRCVLGDVAQLRERPQRRPSRITYQCVDGTPALRTFKGAVVILIEGDPHARLSPLRKERKPAIRPLF